MAKKKHQTEKKPEDIQPPRLPVKPGLAALGGYILLAIALTFPLILRMNSSVYGFYDHISTDLFSNINFYFWAVKHALVDLKSSPIMNPLFAAPFGSRINLVNFTGFVQLPITVIFGHLFSRNFTILFNLVVSGLGMFYLVRHVTKSAAAGFIAGIIFSFCPNMMVRSYTTFDSTQVQWIPFYTLYVVKFIDERIWKNALLAGMFLVFNILFTMPYYLLFLPVHTIVLLIVYAGWSVWGEKRGFENLVRDLISPAALRGWVRIAAALGIVIVVFVVYYTKVVGGAEYSSSIQRTTEHLEQLSLKPADYLMPHPRSALLKGNIKESYWNTKRPGKDPDSFVSYIGYIALALAALGIVRGQRGVFKWMFIAGALVAFWSTLGPALLGIPTPSGLIYKLYAPFARRILIYKVFVQMSIAGLAGIGAAYLFSLEKLKRLPACISVFVLLVLFLVAEYSLVPPALSVNLRTNPEVYERIKELPEDTTLIEVPLKRNSGNLFQGYAYYQTYHEKKLFNPYFGLSRVPERLRSFYQIMEVPLEAQEYANLAALRYLGVTHLAYHRYIGTTTVVFRAFSAPGFASITEKGWVFGEIDGLRRIFTCEREPGVGLYPGPFDYTFANLYELTAEPCPVALTFDYHSPYEPIPGMFDSDGMLECGYMSALVDTVKTFYYPLAVDGRLVRLLRQGGRVTAVNMSDLPVDFSITFTAEAPDSNRVIETKWNGGPVIGQFEIGPEPVRFTVRKLNLEPGGTGELTIWSTREEFIYRIEISGRPANLPTTAVLSDFRVENN